jgi:hypothetical protein
MEQVIAANIISRHYRGHRVRGALWRRNQNFLHFVRGNDDAKRSWAGYY